MKKFAFRLDRLLQLRISAEQEQARELANARRLEDERREASERSAARVDDVMQQLTALPAALCTAGTLSNVLLTLDLAKAGSAAAADAHREAIVQVESELASFDEARQARRALERLREQRQDAWTQEIGRVEQQVVDDVALRMNRGPQAAE